MEQMGQFDSRVILVVIGVLILVTGIVTEILKKVFWQEIPTSLLAFIVAEGLTLVSGFTYAQIAGTTILWHHVVAAAVAGQGVAFSAMFGFDKFIEIHNALNKIKKRKQDTRR